MNHDCLKDEEPEVTDNFQGSFYPLCKWFNFLSHYQIIIIPGHIREASAKSINISNRSKSIQK